MKVNVKKTKMMICNENAGKVTKEGKFPCAVCRKGTDITSINASFTDLSRYVHKRYSGIRGKLKDDSKFKCQACENKPIHTAENCSGVELNSPFLEIVE